MRPIRLTGQNGNSVPVPLDVYAEGQQTLCSFVTAGAPALQMTIDDPFTVAAPAWVAAPAAVNGIFTIPSGIRAVRGTGMVVGDVLVVSQQGLM